MSAARPNPWGGGPWGSGGAAPPSRRYRRLALAQAVASVNVGSRLTTALVDGGEGTGLQWSITGGWTSVDWAGAWPYAVWEFTGSDGAALGGDDQFTANILVRVRTHPGDSSDTNLYVAVVNESDLTTGTIDGVAAGIRWTGAARNVISITTANGTTAGSTGGSGVAGAEYLQASIPRQGKGSTSTLVTGRICLLDSTGAYIASSNVNVAPSNGTTVGSPSKFYVAVAVGRSASTAGTEVLAADVYVARPSRLALPT